MEGKKCKGRWGFKVKVDLQMWLPNSPKGMSSDLLWVASYIAFDKRVTRVPRMISTATPFDSTSDEPDIPSDRAPYECV